MGLLDKAKSWVGGNKGQARSTVEKGADLADDKTGDKYADKIDQGEAKANEQIDKLPDS